MGPNNIRYKISYRNIKYPRLELKTGELFLILPLGYDPNVLLEKHRNWIVKKIEFVSHCYNDSANNKLVERTDREFEEFVQSFTENYSRELGVTPNSISIRKMKTKWGSCSSKGNLTVNMLLKYLPDYLIQYVIFHEIAHMIERRHNNGFWKIVTKRFKNYGELERELFSYWFQVMRFFRI